MRNNLVRLLLIFVVLAAAPQMISASAAPGQKNTNTGAQTPGPPTRRHPGNHCRIRCRVAYDRCLHLAGSDAAKKKACAVRFRWCLRRCGYRR